MKDNKKQPLSLEIQTRICALDADMCRFLCPVAAVEKRETITPGGKNTRVLDLARGDVPFEKETTEVFYHCSGCRACTEWCPNDVDLPAIMEKQLNKVNEKGLAPNESVSLRNKLLRDRSLHRPALENSIQPYRALLSDSPVLYFAGCSTAALYPQAALAFLQLMDAAAEGVSMLHGEECCGQPLAVLGYNEEAREFASALAERVKEGGYKTIVSSCPECVYMFKVRYAEMGIDLGVEVKHVSEYLTDLVAQGRLDFQPKPDTVTYHDPCYLGRYLKLYEEPRELLSKDVGITVVEMDRKAELSTCCGGGFATSTVLPKVATQIAEKRVDEAKKTGAGILVTACPHCREMLGPIATEKGLPVKDISELLADRLKIID